jgi:hypothetical protein
MRTKKFQVSSTNNQIITNGQTTINLFPAETAGYLKVNRSLSFLRQRRIGNPSERFWTSQNDRIKDTLQQRLWGIENLIDKQTGIWDLGFLR